MKKEKKLQIQEKAQENQQELPKGQNPGQNPQSQMTEKDKKMAEKMAKVREAKAKKVETKTETPPSQKEVKEMNTVEKMEESLKNENIPGFEAGTPLNMFQIRDYLMTQPNPKSTLKKMVRKDIVSKQMEKAVVKEMHRIGFNEI